MSGPEHQVTDREALLLDAEHIAKIGSWIWYPETGRVRWSDELYRILGYELGSDATIERFFARLHPDDRERVRAQSSKAAADGLTEPAACRVVRPDGSVLHVEMTGAALRDESGRVERLVGTVRDVTESRATRIALEQAAEILRDAQRIAHLGSWRWRFDQPLAEWSEELMRIHGLPPDDPAPDLPTFLAMIHPEERAIAAEALERAREGHPETRYEVRIVRPDQSVRHLSCEARPLLDEQGRMIGLHGTVLDVTEQRLLERQLRQAQKLEAVGRLAGGIAHDFNNLLTIILMSADVARSRQRLDPLEDILEAGRRAQALTRQLLTFSRQAVSRARSFDACEATQNGVNLVRRLIGEDIAVDVRCPEGTLVVHLDESAFQQVLVNIMINARDAMPKGGAVHVAVEPVVLDAPAQWTEPPLAPGEYVALVVVDNGTGMDERTQQRALEPFFTTKELGVGTGLGLSTVFGIASQAGGAVAIESALGRGTTVRVLFPRTELVVRGRSDSEDAPALGGHERILLVEDDAALARVLQQLLASAGYEVVAHTHPRGALAETSRFDLLLTDLVLPEMNGARLAEQLKDRVGKVLFATGYAPATMEDALPPAAAIVTKPLTPKHLLRCVRAVLDGAPLPRE